MQTNVLSVLQLKTPSDSYALMLPGPNGEDRLRIICPCIGAKACYRCNALTGHAFDCDLCQGQAWVPTPNSFDVLAAARLKWPDMRYESSPDRGRHTVWLWIHGVGWMWSEEDTDEQRMLSCFQQALEREGARP